MPIKAISGKLNLLERDIHVVLKDASTGKYGSNFHGLVSRKYKKEPVPPFEPDGIWGITPDHIDVFFLPDDSMEPDPVDRDDGYMTQAEADYGLAENSESNDYPPETVLYTTEYFKDHYDSSMLLENTEGDAGQNYFGFGNDPFSAGGEVEDFTTDLGLDV